MKVTTKLISKRDKVPLSGMMAEFIKEISNKGAEMEKVLFIYQMVLFIKATLKKMKKMDIVKLAGQMEVALKAIGKQINVTVMEL